MNREKGAPFSLPNRKRNLFYRDLIKVIRCDTRCAARDRRRARKKEEADENEIIIREEEIFNRIVIRADVCVSDRRRDDIRGVCCRRAYRPQRLEYAVRLVQFNYAVCRQLCAHRRCDHHREFDYWQRGAGEHLCGDLPERAQNLGK